MNATLQEVVVGGNRTGIVVVWRWLAGCEASDVLPLPTRRHPIFRRVRSVRRALLALHAALVIALPRVAAAQMDVMPEEPEAAPARPKAPAVPAPAWPACGDDLVVLHDGGMVRGQIVELRPREYISLHLSTGKVVVVPWTDVHHVEQGGPRSETCPNVSPTASAPLDEAGSVFLESDAQGVFLEVKRDDGWELLCTSPCRAEAPRNGYYRVGGSNIRTSTPFRVQGAAGDTVKVQVDGGNKAAFGMGVVSVTVGGLLLCVAYVEALQMAGPSSVPFGYTYEGRYASSRGTSNGHQTMAVSALFAGLTATVIGSVLIHHNVKTTVAQLVTDLRAAPPPPPAPHRVAPFKEARITLPGPLDPKPAMALPVFRGTF